MQSPETRLLRRLLVVMCSLTAILSVGAFWFRTTTVNDAVDRNRELIHENCLTGQRGWDFDHAIILSITEQVTYKPTDDEDLLAAEMAANAKRAQQREDLLKLADGRPDCPD